MTCDYPAPCCCCCPCCEDIPPFLALTMQNVGNTERCDGCGWFNRTFVLALQDDDDDAQCPHWSCTVEVGPCPDTPYEVHVDLYMTNPPAELGGGYDACEIALVIDDSSGETVMYPKLLGSLPTDCYSMSISAGGDCIDYEDINNCCFNATTFSIQGSNSPS